jgi:hypothetical protein
MTGCGLRLPKFDLRITFPKVMVYKHMSAVHPKSYQRRLMSLRAVVGYKTSHFSSVTIFFNIFARRFSSKNGEGIDKCPVCLSPARKNQKQKNKDLRSCLVCLENQRLYQHEHRKKKGYSDALMISEAGRGCINTRSLQGDLFFPSPVHCTLYSQNNDKADR